MTNLPVVNSPVQILRMEVWVTNRNGTTTQADMVGLMDLGECTPYNPNIIPLPGSPYPAMAPTMTVFKYYGNPNMPAIPSQVTTRLNALGFSAVQDFEKTFARKWIPMIIHYNPPVGYISLNQPCSLMRYWQ